MRSWEWRRRERSWGWWRRGRFWVWRCRGRSWGWRWPGEVLGMAASAALWMTAVAPLPLLMHVAQWKPNTYPGRPEI